MSDLYDELESQRQREYSRLGRVLLLSLVVVAWQWVEQAAAAQEGLGRAPSAADRAFYEGKLAAAQYWILTELPRVGTLGALCRSGEDSYARAQPEWF